jgi:DNA-binding SARP family transcriptional activator
VANPFLIDDRLIVRPTPSAHRHGIVKRPLPEYAEAMLRIRAVGAFRIEVDGHDRTPKSFDRAAALLAWLALNPGLHPRSAVAARFWPDVLDESARASLRSALWSLRRLLGEDANGVVVATRERVGLGDDVWVDVRELDELLARGNLEDALALADGELLPGFADEWVYDARDEHRTRTVELLEAVAAAAESAGDVRRAVELSRRASALEPLSEEVHRALMRRLAAVGDRGAALAVFSELRTRMLQKLRVGPSEETRLLAESLRAEPTAPAVPARLRRIDSALFVGRDDELERLRRLSSVSRETTPIALIAGEAGSGKSRLAARYAVEVAQAGETVLYGACAEQALVPYEPFADALGEPGIDAADIAERLSAAPGDRILLVLDDLQWADRPTLALLARVLRGPLSGRLALIAAYREDEAEADLYGALADLRRDCDVDRIELGGLGLEEVAALIGSAFETSAAAAQARAIHDRTGGNPFYVRELARHVAERPQTASGDVPEGIRDVVRARVERLSDECADALARASVLGEVFDVETLAALSGRGDEPLGPLEEGVAAGILDEVGAGRYRFAHALTRDAIYGGLGASRRARLHRAAAQALVRRHGDEPGPHLAEIALHRCEGAADGTDVDSAVELAALAARWSSDRGADGPAVTLLTRALVVLPDGEVRRRQRLAAQRAVAFQRLWHALADL